MDVGAEKVQLGFLKVLHGSAMEAEAARYGIEYQKSAPYEVTRTDAIAPSELALLHEIEYLLDRTYNSGLFPGTVRWFSRQCGGYFAFFRKWNDLAKEGKPPRNWTEEELAASLLAFGERRNIPFGRDFLRWDALCRNFRPRLPEFLEQPGREAERRAFYRDFPEEWVPENRKGKRPGIIPVWNGFRRTFPDICGKESYRRKRQSFSLTMRQASGGFWDKSRSKKKVKPGSNKPGPDGGWHCAKRRGGGESISCICRRFGITGILKT